MVLCDCGKQAIILTSWTDKNPGINMPFHRWVDRTNCNACVNIIPKLLRNRNMLE
ncbi:hypothetical protein Hanom_Chr11g01035571 [Helianthus anomalus]